jgi:hypothetical protein
MPINCSKCGRFVGDDGYKDVFYDDYTGGWEIGFPLCKKCKNSEGVLDDGNERKGSNCQPKKYHRVLDI